MMTMVIPRNTVMTISLTNAVHVALQAEMDVMERMVNVDETVSVVLAVPKVKMVVMDVPAFVVLVDVPDLKDVQVPVALKVAPDPVDLKVRMDVPAFVVPVDVPVPKAAQVLVDLKVAPD